MSGAPLVTGGGGFAGGHLLELLRSRDEEPHAPRRTELDLLDREAVRRELRRRRPRSVFHLAALASVARSWQNPAEPIVDNAVMTLNVLSAAQLESPETTIVLASSGEVYGPPESLPVDEGAPLRPQNPYAVSKAACDLLGGQYADAHGMRVVRMRAFNHAGPGQSDEYVVGTLTRQVAQAELEGRDEVTLMTGNVDAARDFTDVRDVVRAYADAPSLEPDVYNVCSGRSLSVRELIEALGRVASVEVRYEVDPARLRPVDVPDVRGSAERLADASGWRPEIGLERTLSDAVAAWRERLTGDR